MGSEHPSAWNMPSGAVQRTDQATRHDSVLAAARWRSVNRQATASAHSPFPGACSAFCAAHPAVFAAHSAITPRRPHRISKPIFRKSYVPNRAAAHRVGGHEQEQTSCQRHQRPRPPLANQPNVVAQCCPDRFNLRLHNPYPRTCASNQTFICSKRLAIATEGRS